MSFITADKTFHRIMSAGVPELDRLLGGGLEVGLMHRFYGSRLLRDKTDSWAREPSETALQFLNHLRIQSSTDSQ